MSDKLWTPQRVLPDVAKKDGGSYFDDEMELTADRDQRLIDDATELLNHVRQRPDHVVYVGSIEDRDMMREVFNWWKRERLIGHNPTIKIEYAVPTGTVRIDEER